LHKAKGVLMSTNKTVCRPAPAYQEYASDILANRSYRAMSLAERGLWDTIKKECWVNGSVPSHKPELAKYLGLPLENVIELMTPNLMTSFKVVDSDLICPELDGYRLQIEDRRQRQSVGGKNGGKKAQSNRRNENEASLEARVKPLSRDETSRNEQKRRESSKENLSMEEHKEWIEDYENVKPPSPNDRLNQFKRY
jgi:hypothetical protein